jgi:hypothetical protein
VGKVCCGLTASALYSNALINEKHWLMMKAMNVDDEPINSVDSMGLVKG